MDGGARVHARGDCTGGGAGRDDRDLRLRPYLTWVTPIALLVALVAGGIATMRMWHWQSGKVPACRGCKGPLGRLQHGEHGDYRKCLACGGNQAV